MNRNKILVVMTFVILIVPVLIGMHVFNNVKEEKISQKAVEVYGNIELDVATKSTLESEVYNNIILPSELKSILELEESVTVYFFSPTCSSCTTSAPEIVSAAKELEIDLKLYNILVFEEGWEDYNIERAPSVIHFENGVEVGRLKGGWLEKDYLDWFTNLY